MQLRAQLLPSVVRRATTAVRSTHHQPVSVFRQLLHAQPTPARTPFTFQAAHTPHFLFSAPSQRRRDITTHAVSAEILMSAPLLGGALLGTATASYLFLTGRVLGISGAVKGLIQGDRSWWRVAFLAGLLLPVPYLLSLLPGALTPLPPSLPVSRTLLSGLLVGLGAALGNGCTSGHGICGNARLSPRSIAFTLLFMTAGAASVALFGSAQALAIPASASSLTPFSPQQLTLAAALAGGCLALLAAANVASRVASNHLGPSSTVTSAANLVSTAAVGATFSTGLLISGMVNPQKVVGFLAVGTPAWDPSLMLVMGGALAVSMLPFQWVVRRQRDCNCPAPLLSKAYSLPSNTTPIDTKLVLGGALFGVGWGLSGMCPGPALIAGVASTAGPAVWSYLAGMLVGMAAEPVVGGLLTAPAQARPAPTTDGPTKS